MDDAQLAGAMTVCAESFARLRYEQKLLEQK
jgi:hypothetical protein